MQHKFVEYIPDEVSEGIIYVSMQFGTAIHKCCCGCGQEVVTPITPTDWQLTFDGESITLNPSIGNWNFNCQSHYFIRKNGIVWCSSWNKQQVSAEKLKDKQHKDKYYSKTESHSLLKLAWLKVKRFFCLR